MNNWMEAAWARARGRAIVLLSFVGAIWLAHLVNATFDYELTALFGLVPRRLDGLDGVVAMPFLHGNFEHLQRNTVPLLVLGALILWMAPSRFWPATIVIVLVGGLLIWFFAREARHIGASALVFGWMGFVVAFGFFERTREALASGVVAVVVFGAEIILGLSPAQEQVSWDGHLAGLVAGVFAAFVLRSRRRRRPPAPTVVEFPGGRRR